MRASPDPAGRGPLPHQSERPATTRPRRAAPGASAAWARASVEPPGPAGTRRRPDALRVEAERLLRPRGIAGPGTREAVAPTSASAVPVARKPVRRRDPGAVAAAAPEAEVRVWPSWRMVTTAPLGAGGALRAQRGGHRHRRGEPASITARLVASAECARARCREWATRPPPCTIPGQLCSAAGASKRPRPPGPSARGGGERVGDGRSGAGPRAILRASHGGRHSTVSPRPAATHVTSVRPAADEPAVSSRPCS